jgi:hypothetical protein
VFAAGGNLSLKIWGKIALKIKTLACYLPQYLSPFLPWYLSLLARRLPLASAAAR